MPNPLPSLRSDLDVMPSPLPEQPGLLIRDPFRYSETTLVIPPLLARCLVCFDGAQDESDLRATLARLTGQVAVADIAKRLVAALRDAGFLDDDRFAELRAAREREFAAAAERTAAHAGSGYPEERPALTRRLRGYFNGTPAGKPRRDAGDGPAATRGIAAPHVSPEGGSASYAAAYRALDPADGERVFVVLGTSHYGEPDRFGLTRKPFATPFGATTTDGRLVSTLARAAGPAAGKPPEASDGVARFVDALGDLAAREGDRLFFVLGVDMTHIGRRYGDPLRARAGVGPLLEVQTRDRARIARLEAGDAGGFWELVRDGGTPEQGFDPLKWCGSAPFYTLHRALPHARGTLLHYEQWNIDEESVVTFGAIALRG